MNAKKSDTNETPTFEKGSWQETLQKSSKLLDTSANAKRRASGLLWAGANSAIESWLPNSSTDVNGERLYGDVLLALGESRKGDASKIKTVALAVKNNGLDLSQFENLSRAYGAARALTVVAAQEEAEDDAAEKAIEGIEAPKSTSSVDGAAALLLSKGVDGAVVAILDALGSNNEAAHRAFLRAVSAEISARTQAKAKAEADAKKAEADRIRAEKAKEKAEADAVKAKEKAAKKTAAKKAPAPVATKGKGKPAKGKPAAKAEAKVTTTESTEDTETSAPVTKAKTKGRPVVRRPGR